MRRSNFALKPRRPGGDRFGGRLYELVRLEDGSIAFVRNALQAEIEQALAQGMERLFGKGWDEEL